MTFDLFVERLRNSSMIYSMKISFFMVGLQETPCQKHPEKGFQGCKTSRYEALRDEERDRKTEIRDKYGGDDDKWCFSQCTYPIDIKFLNEKQRELYREFRPLEKKRSDCLKHPENEEIFHKHFPELVKQIIKVST